jgi:hypothetical protein
VSDLKTPKGAFPRDSCSRAWGAGLRRLTPGALDALPSDGARFDGNFVAVPEERLPEIERFSQRPSGRGGLSSPA